MRRQMLLKFEHLGGSACLDFVNTVAWADGVPYDEERLCDYGDVIAWAASAGLLNAAQTKRLRTMALAHPVVARRAFNSLIELRALLHRVFSAVPARAENATDVESIRVLALAAMQTSRLVRIGGVYEVLLREPDAVEWIGEAVARDALRLLTSPDLDHVRSCANDTCGWVFVDSSRRHNRRWCDMRECGNRVKVRRYYRRTRSADTSGGSA